MHALEEHSEIGAGDRDETVSRIAVVEDEIERPGQLLAPYRDWKREPPSCREVLTLRRVGFCPISPRTKFRSAALSASRLPLATLRVKTCIQARCRFPAISECPSRAMLSS